MLRLRGWPITRGAWARSRRGRWTCRRLSRRPWRARAAYPTQSPAGLLALYGLYKQATEGDATGARPGLLDVRGRAKFDAWAGRAGQSREAAMKEYIETVDRLGGGTD
jgi:acyl-CoA-binding protein